MTDEASRPELFFLYGVIISVIILMIFFTSIRKLSDFEDIMLEFTADEIALTTEAIAARHGYTFLPIRIERLTDPTLSISEEGILRLSYDPLKTEGEGLEGSDETRPDFSESRRLVVRTEPSSVSGASIALISQERVVRIDRLASCQNVESNNVTIGDIQAAQMVTVIVSDPSRGCVEFERIVERRGSEGSVQRVIVRSEDMDAYGAEVVIFAR